MAQLAEGKIGTSNRMMKTWHIHIEGRVQGVGFRPFIYRLAKSQNLLGEVANTCDGVHINLSAKEEDLHTFVAQIQTDKPIASKIVRIHCSEITHRVFNDFRIVESVESHKVNLLITPDIAMCKKCSEEIEQTDNRRLHYAFTTCTQCGPRFSIMKGLPYDRAETSMRPFAMCEVCKKEYDSVEDRRFYSQTNSCLSCGVGLSWIKGGGVKKATISKAVELLNDGQIIAVRGIGGFLLMADASNKKSIETLRVRKNRPKKPFACLFNNEEEVAKYALINEQESNLLNSPEAPIVLLELKKKLDEFPFEPIAPGLNKIGAMLPYAPLLKLICSEFGKPLIATSANVSGSPIVFEDKEALRLLDPIADAILSHNREITFPQDDSVVAISPKHHQKVMLRRSRGYAPSFEMSGTSLPDNLLAFGAEMKSAFAVTSSGNTYLSQFLGDASKYESQTSFNRVLGALLKLLKTDIETVLIDAHPNYHSGQEGREWALSNKKNLRSFQHHKTHFGAILCEHNLLDSEEKVLGIVWDGMGYGEDGNIWGGEFFLFDKKSMHRVSHLGYFPYLANNRMSKEPTLAALAASWPLTPKKFIKDHFKEEELSIHTHFLQNPRVETSSIGRLFDAVAGLLGICHLNSFEGEASMKLQACAEKSTLKSWQVYPVISADGQLKPHDLMYAIEQDRPLESKENIALKFHQTLVQWIEVTAALNKCKQLAFSGGVFQNTLLIDLIIDKLGKKHQLFFHKNLPPNDENCAIGQMALMKLENDVKIAQLTNVKTEICV